MLCLDDWFRQCSCRRKVGPSDHPCSFHLQVNERSAAGGITVDLREMRGIIVDPVQQTAVAQGALYLFTLA